MEHWSPRQLLVLLLGIFVVLGVSLSAIQAGGMAVKMTLASEMPESGTSGQDGCTGCPGGDGAGSAGACFAVCTLTAVAVMPIGPAMAMAGTELPAVAVEAIAAGRLPSPDPSPPKGSVSG